MQESLYDTVIRFQKGRKVNVEELETILDSDIEEVVTLCKKACLKPKTDTMGNAYFTGEDVDILRKMKELYSQAKNTQKKLENMQETPRQEVKQNNENLVSPTQKINFLAKAKNRAKSLTAYEASSSFGLQNNLQSNFQNSLQKLESNLIDKFSDMLSEKMDGFDEIIVELIRSKTENENLRAQVNELNKQVFNMKKELALYTPLPFGFYTKKESDEV